MNTPSLTVCFLSLFFFLYFLGVNFDFFGIGEFWGVKVSKTTLGFNFAFIIMKERRLLVELRLKLARV